MAAMLRGFVVPGRGRRAHAHLVCGRDDLGFGGVMVGGGVVGLRGVCCMQLESGY